MKYLFIIFSIICIFFTCFCYELNQQEQTDRDRIIIGIIGSIMFITGLASIILYFHW